jgi:hypothetical protein
MKDTKEEIIPLQVGSELRIRIDGSLVMGNPEVELAKAPQASDAVLSYRYDASAKEHIIRLLDPVADHQHQKHHHRDD